MWTEIYFANKAALTVAATTATGSGNWQQQLAAATGNGNWQLRQLWAIYDAAAASVASAAAVNAI